MTARRAFTLIEFVVASVLIISVFAVSSQVLISNQRRQSDNTKTDQAARIAVSSLETAKALGCSLGTGDERAEAGDDGFTTRTAVRCHAALLDTAPGNEAAWDWATDPDTDTDPFTVTRGDTDYTVEMTSQWLTGGDNAPLDCTVEPADQPQMLRRDVTVSWTAFGRDESLTRTAFEATPPDAIAFHDTNLGGLVVTAAAGEPVTVTPQGGPAGHTLRRVASADGCAWFPFLSPGFYSVNGSSTLHEVEAGAQTAVSS